MNAWRRVNQFMKKYFPTVWLAIKIATVGAVSLVVLILLGSAILSVYGSRKLDAVRAEAVAKGVALSMKEIIARRPVIPENENAANVYEAAFALIPVDSERTDEPVPMVNTALGLSDARLTAKQKAIHDELNRVQTNPSEPLAGYILDATRKYVEIRRGAIELICKAATLPECSYHIDWLGGRSKPGQVAKSVRRAGRFMCLAVWIDAEEGRTAEAVAKTRATIALASSLSGEPDYGLSVWSRSFALTMAVEGLMRVVSRTDVSSEDLLAIQKDLEHLLTGTFVRNTLEIKLASTCDSYAASLDSRSYSSGSGTGAPVAGAGAADGNADASLYPLVWLLRGALKLDEAAMIKCYVAFLDNPDDPGTASMKAAEEVAAIVGAKWRFPAKSLPSRVRSEISYLSSIAPRAEATAAALAALRYRNDTGKWPETLDALVPTYLAKVPVEPFNQRPFVYRVLSDGIMVYSVGDNGGDDGGRPKLIAPAPNDKARYDDIGFRIWK